MDAFLRHVLEQRQREDDARYQRTPLAAIPTSVVELAEELRERRVTQRDVVLRMFLFADEIDAAAVAAEIGRHMDWANSLLSRLCADGDVERVRPGVYRRARKGDA